MTIQDFPNEDLKLVAELCGIDVAKSLLEKLSGISINIPKKISLEINKKNIIEELNTGLSVKRLALKFNTSEANIYRIISKNKRKN